MARKSNYINYHRRVDYRQKAPKGKRYRTWKETAEQQRLREMENLTRGSLTKSRHDRNCGALYGTACDCRKEKHE
jgi:hypothetical protein